MIDVLIVDDNPIVRAAIRIYLDGDDDIQVVGEASDGRTALSAVQRLRPAVTLLDHRMPIADGLSVISRLAEQTAVVVITSDSGADVIAGMLRGGARGYLVHGEFDPPELLRAVRSVAAGSGWLSPAVASVTISVLRDHAVEERAAADRTDQTRRNRAAYGLTAREVEVLELIGEGYSNAAIGRRLTITEKTVKNHLNHVFTKLGVTNRTEAAIRWMGSR
uniref:response regulator n=1 Tax=Paractinoplanes polyasparticus TaxID=2856853 RepID=UPI001C849484|nr:response regulator transcription factor [Actinoplanes polyasparticus]